MHKDFMMEKKKINFVSLSSIVSAFLIVSSIVSCGKEETMELPDYSGWGIDSIAMEKGDNFEITYQFKDGVIVLNKELIHYLKKVEDDSILFFNSDMPDSISPHIGTIYSARVTELTPYGLGNEVLSISEDEGFIRCVTSVAPLDEIFKVLELKVKLSRDDFIDKEGGIYDEDGTFHQSELANFDDLDWGCDSLRARSRYHFGSPEVLVIPAKLKNDGNGLFSDISLALGGVLTVEKNKELGTFENSGEFFVGIEGRVGFEAEAETPNKSSLKAHIFNVTILNSVIIAGPVIFRPYVKADINLKAKACATASIGIAYKGSYKFGWNENGIIRENYFRMPHLKDLITSFELNGKTQLGPEITFNTGVGLYTRSVSVLLRPTIWFCPGGELYFEIGKNTGKKANANADAIVSFDIEGGLEGAIEARLFGKSYEIGTSTINDLALNFLNLRAPIFPTLEYSSFSIEPRENLSPLVFDAQYTMTGGIIAKLMGCKPALRVDKDGEEVHTYISDSHLGFTTPTLYNFELDGLESNTVYEAVPMAVHDKFIYEWKEKSFSTNNTVIYTGTCPDSNHPHALDLGLPSGTIWSCCNLGSTRPEIYGTTYAWGETKNKATYSWGNYLYYNGATNTCKDIGEEICGTQYDAAKIEWGNDWQIPTKEQFGELLEYLRSGNLTTFDLPMLREGYYSSDYSGHYWTSTISSDNDQKAFHVFARYRGSASWSRTRYEMDVRDRYNGYAIRPVKGKRNK